MKLCIAKSMYRSSRNTFCTWKSVVRLAELMTVVTIVMRKVEERGGDPVMCPLVSRFTSRSDVGSQLLTLNHQSSGSLQHLAT